MSDIDNADLDLSGVSLSRPLIDKQTLLCRTGEVKWETSEDGRFKNLVVPLTLEESAKSTKDEDIHIGFQHTDRILATPTGGLTLDMIKEKLARFQVAVLKLDKPEAFGDVSRYSGQLVKVAFKIRQDKNDPEKQYQDVAKFVKAS